ncbi:cyclase family protein [Aeromicrobium endophyticum]|uniref:Cyclase family protein n=1 Tax=Aeromicrobium endophyticum TaxID=2292704 RepID=A0A371P2L7_9ACTN|nr:cyclase family protein [Aeromicrobium endophyticum]REK70203.1 cyclase family protein [Aeromicrobium endophyticum]
MSPESWDRADPAGAIASAADRCSNVGRWGADDVLGTLNYIDDEARRRAAQLVRTGQVVSLSQPFDSAGPQNGWRGRTNPVRTMLTSGLDHEHAEQGFFHGLGGADDVVFMPLQAATQWDGLGHIFDHGMAWNGRRAGEVVTSEGDLVTGIETAADRLVGRGVLLDVGRALAGDGELEDGYAISPDDLDQTLARQDVSVGTGDFVLVRTGQLARAQRGVADGSGWGTYAGGPAPGLSFATIDWLHDHQVAAVATDTWGVEVRPNEFDEAFQPFHQVVIPHLGLFLGELWDLDTLARECAADDRYEFMLCATPIPFTGAVGSPVHPVAIR